MLTKRQVLQEYGFNAKTFDALIETGIVKVVVRPGKRKTVFVPKASLDSLLEGEHYVVCRCCGSRQAQISTKHLRSCAGVSLQEYREKYPDAFLMARWTARRRCKTPVQRAAQSEKLKARFTTKVGEETRRVISEASKRMHEKGYRDRATVHLKSLNQSPEMREMHRTHTQARWNQGTLRETVTSWHAENRERSLASIAHARRHLQRISRPHRKMKAAMKEAGLQEFQTEYPVAWYSIDEAMPGLRLAVEVDGCYWHGCESCGMPGTSRIRRIDKSKQTYLENRGWTVLRFPEHRINRDVQGCVAELLTIVNEMGGPS